MSCDDARSEEIAQPRGSHRGSDGFRGLRPRRAGARPGRARAAAAPAEEAAPPPRAIRYRRTGRHDWGAWLGGRTLAALMLLKRSWAVSLEAASSRKDGQLSLHLVPACAYTMQLSARARMRACGPPLPRGFMLQARDQRSDGQAGEPGTGAQEKAQQLPSERRWPVASKKCGHSRERWVGTSPPLQLPAPRPQSPARGIAGESSSLADPRRLSWISCCSAA